MIKLQNRENVAYVICNLCGADDFKIVFPAGYAQLHRIVRCKRCNLMYANPQELIDAEEFEGVENLPPLDDPSFAQYLQKQQVQLPDNLRALRKLNGYLPTRGKLLEIGSYMGTFANEIRNAG